MNSGCYGHEISDILISIKALDFKGNFKEFKRDEINFFYRGTSLPENLIILSAKFEAKIGEKKLIKDKIEKYSIEKKNSQPSQIKTCGSTLRLYYSHLPREVGDELVVFLNVDTYLYEELPEIGGVEL